MTDGLRRRDGDQPLPVINDQPFIHDLVIADLERRRDMAADGFDTFNRAIDDMRSRKALGAKRYGTPLQPFNGRNVHLDVNEELADAAAYSRQALFEAGLSPWDDANMFDQRVVVYQTICWMLILSRKLLDIEVGA